MSKKILIVEDNELNMKLFNDLLESKGYEIVQTRDGMETLNLARQHKPDLILMDIQMPIMDGLTATDVLRKEIDYRNPIIGVSANVLKEDVDRAMSAGMDDYLAKPVIKDALYKVIRKWLNISDKKSR